MSPAPWTEIPYPGITPTEELEAIARGDPNPNGFDRDEVSAELAYRAAWPAKPRGRGWVRTEDTPPLVGVAVLGYYPGHFSGRRFLGGEFLVVWLTRFGEWSSAREDTFTPAYWRPIPGAAGTLFPD